VLPSHGATERHMDWPDLTSNFLFRADSEKICCDVA